MKRIKLNANLNNLNQLLQPLPETTQQYINGGKNSNGRRCRWVKGKGLICDGGAFGTFNP
ncbi:hypothetical protein IFO70_23575 [Phormidium tenue FACHB-886]|nr:hypothetical protein [Phormidium tenue FACHB-886]